jgi:hypothetical protein
LHKVLLACIVHLNLARDSPEFANFSRRLCDHFVGRLYSFNRAAARSASEFSHVVYVFNNLDDQALATCRLLDGLLVYLPSACDSTTASNFATMGVSCLDRLALAEFEMMQRGLTWLPSAALVRIHQPPPLTSQF